MIQIGEYKIPQTSSREELDPFFGQLHRVISLINCAVKVLIQLRKQFLGPHHALRPIYILFKGLIVGHDVQENRILRIPPFGLEKQLNRLVPILLILEPISNIFQNRAYNCPLILLQIDYERFDL